MNSKETIQQLILLPKNFSNLDNVSINSLLKASGYLENYSQISETDIRNEIVCNPDCIKEWFQFSEDKRTNKGWYLKKYNGTYIVGYLTPTGDETQKQRYDKDIDACAAFIKREIEALRTD